jgi:hypothetical protein
MGVLTISIHLRISQRFRPTIRPSSLLFAAGLRQSCTDIIRFSHGASSSRKVYRSSFIPGLHDVCMIFAMAYSAINLAGLNRHISEHLGCAPIEQKIQTRLF